jgi:MFS family permease
VLGCTLAIQAASVGILVYCFALFVVPWLDEFDAPRRDLMFAIASLQVMVGLMSPLAGRAMDAVRMRTLVLAGLGVLVVGLVLAARATEVWHLLVLYATVFPLAMALMGTLAAQTLIARWFTEQRGLAIGISATGTNLGGILFPALAAALLADVGWRPTLDALALAAVVLVGPLVWWVLKREPAVRTIAAGTDVAPERIWTTREILASAAFWVPILAIAPLNVAFGAVQFNVGAFASDLALGEHAAALIVLTSACMVAGKFVFGAIGDRVDHRSLYWTTATFMVAGLLLLRGEPDMGRLIAGVACVGLSGGGILPMLGIVVGSRFGVASFGRAMGLAMLAITAGAAGPIVAGAVFDATGSYDPAFLAFAALIVPGAILMVRLPPRIGA